MLPSGLWSGEMSGDPKECRAHARRCSELAAVAKEPRLKKTLSHLAACWLKLASDLETARGLRNELGVEARDEANDAGAYTPARKSPGKAQNVAARGSVLISRAVGPRIGASSNAPWPQIRSLALGRSGRPRTRSAGAAGGSGFSGATHLA
jgi:hypothetical protein